MNALLDRPQEPFSKKSLRLWQSQSVQDTYKSVGNEEKTFASEGNLKERQKNVTCSDDFYRSLLLLAGLMEVFILR